MEIFDNKEALAEVLYDAIRDEARRIVATGVATSEQVLGYINPQIESAISKNTDDTVTDELVLALNKVHLKLMTSKLPGDLPTIEAKKKEEPKAEAEEEEVVCTCPPNESCTCGARKSEAAVVETVRVAIAQLEEKLSGLIRNLGINGHHTQAFAVERKLNELKRLAVDGELMVTAAFMAEVSLVQEFKDKIPGVDISLEVRKKTAEFGDPLVAIHELRNKWKMEL